MNRAFSAGGRSGRNPRRGELLMNAAPLALDRYASIDHSAATRDAFPGKINLLTVLAGSGIQE
jgi:hypothetical protein